MSFNGKPKATVWMSHRAIEAVVAFGLPLNESGNHCSMPMNNADYLLFFSRTRGDSASVKSTISSPVDVLMSWCRLKTSTPVAA